MIPQKSAISNHPLVHHFWISHEKNPFEYIFIQKTYYCISRSYKGVVHNLI